MSDKMTVINKYLPKVTLILAMQLTIAQLHVARLGQRLDGNWRVLYSSYFSDLVLPFSFYFLLCLAEIRMPRLRPWWVKAGLVFGAAACAEILQGLGIYALGSTFDPLDIAAYAAGVLLAVFVEQVIFSHSLPFWKLEQESPDLPPV